METHQIVRTLRSQSTWRLFLLSAITYMVYAGFYARDQSRALNCLLPSDRGIPRWFSSLVFNLQIASGVVFVAFLFVEDGHPIEELSNGVDLASGVALLVWGFVARSRANLVFRSERGDDHRFSALWTFLFTPFYFNYKVNSIATHDDPNERQSADVDPT